MATMYSLFFVLLFAFVWAFVGLGDGIVGEVRGSGYELRGSGYGVRERIVGVAFAEIGIREATGNNDGPRVEEYLRYTGLGTGHAWCAAFVSWCFGQAGLSQPRNPWSPALFPKARTYWNKVNKDEGVRNKDSNAGVRHLTRVHHHPIKPADLFGIYGETVKRINHVGLVERVSDNFLITIEGNSNNRVESRRRHLSTIYALSDWVD